MGKKTLENMPEEQNTADLSTAPTIDNSKVVELMGKLVDNFESLNTRLSAMEETIVQIQGSATEPPQLDKKVERGDESEIIKAARNILGEQFEIFLKPHQPGMNFRLEIVPPEHLREDENDRRIKVISYVEGVSGAKVYAQKVKEHTVKFANARGVTWQMAMA